MKGGVIVKMKPAKLFISHASEDKQDFADSLAVALKEAGYDVWYDKWALVAGDSLLKKISQGLRECDFGIVLLSKNFFGKKWPQSELDGLFALETEERKVILPIWKSVTFDDVKAFSSILAGRLGIPADIGVKAVVAEINRAVEVARTVESFSVAENALSRFRNLDRRLAGAKKAQALSSTEEGVIMAREAAHSALTFVKTQLVEFGQTSEVMKFDVDPKSKLDRLKIWCPYKTTLLAVYSNQYFNSVEQGLLYIIISHPKAGEWIDESKEQDIVKQYDFRPHFDHTLKVIWEGNSLMFTTEQLGSFVLEELVNVIAGYHEEAERRKRRPD